MCEIQNYGSFISAVLLFQLFPGAGTVAILNATARNGIGSGMKSVFGTLSGDLIYMLAAVLGLATILSHYPGILEGAQWIGVLYLCWIGLKFLRLYNTDNSSDIALVNEGWAHYRQALAVSLTNPKVIIFFMAFFPLFLKADSKPVTLFILIIHVTIISLLYQTGLVLVGNALAKRLSKWRYLRLVATRLPGVAIIGFSIRLAFNIK